MRTTRKLSNEHRQKISEAMKGQNNPNFGKNLSPEHRAKIAQSLQLYWKNIPEN
ncbi:NUMOD3 domain-containing DNA-binding protein [Dysgonomonas sp. 520]|uniref:NUMOD3 domain-containing DNA-binding protein n=1 Tax=Dysgonomonas sp. 520 TaxID=2302931 RepID=UPI0013D5B2AF|nr:NUMOD3 domain-containing DNA-binding protein [Dysgonomonas sp. 520]NDW11212.1 hypothetical protein [Dysgonomonas sp. 520]